MYIVFLCPFIQPTQVKYSYTLGASCNCTHLDVLVGSIFYNYKPKMLHYNCVNIVLWLGLDTCELGLSAQ